MVRVLHCCLILVFPKIALAAKPDDPIVRVGATIFMVLLVALIGLAWKLFKSKRDAKKLESAHKKHMSRQSALISPPSTAHVVSKVVKAPECDSSSTQQSHQMPNSRVEQVSRNELSPEEAALGHWVSYIDFRTSYEKITRTQHYVATHWYIDKNKLNIVQLEIKGLMQVPKMTRTMTFNILDRSEDKRMLRFEMFDEPGKKDYWQGTFRLGADNLTMLHDEVIPRYSKVVTKWNYVDSSRNP